MLIILNILLQIIFPKNRYIGKPLFINVNENNYKKCPSCGALNFLNSSRCTVCSAYLPENTVYTPIASKPFTSVTKPTDEPVKRDSGSNDLYNNLFTQDWILSKNKIAVTTFKSNLFYILFIGSFIPFLSVLLIIIHPPLPVMLLIPVSIGVIFYILSMLIYTAGKKHFNNGVSLFSKEKYNEAIAEFNKSFNNGYNIIGSLYNSSLSYKRVNNYQNAKNAINAILQHDNTNYLAIKLNGDLEIMHNNNEALALYQQSIKSNTGNPFAWNNMGKCLELMGRRKDALPCYEYATKIYGGYKIAWENKGDLLYMLGYKTEGDYAYEVSSKL